MRVALLLMALLVATSFASETEEVISNIHRVRRDFLSHSNFKD
jgi:hypothetical protein